MAGGALLAGCGDAESSGGAANVQTNPRVQWRLASSFSRSLDTIYGAAEVLADRVAEITDNRFTIRVHPGGEIVPALQVLDNVQTGTVQIGHSASYYYVGKNPAFAFDTCVPFGLSARQLNGWLYYGNGLELLRGLFAEYGVINFPGGNTGVQMGGWFRRQIGSLRDLRGVKMRIPGMGGDVMDRLGVSVQVIPSNEIYPALERGVIDASEWVGPYDDEKLGLHKVASHYYYPGWWEPGPGLSFYVNQSAWDKLPSTYQAALAAAAAEANVGMMASYDAKNPAALERLVQGGTQLHKFSDDIMQAAHREAFDLMETRASEDATYRGIFDSFVTYRNEAYTWFGTAERAFSEFANTNLESI